GARLDGARRLRAWARRSDGGASRGARGGPRPRAAAGRRARDRRPRRTNELERKGARGGGGGEGGEPRPSARGVAPPAAAGGGGGWRRRSPPQRSTRATSRWRGSSGFRSSEGC